VRLGRRQYSIPFSPVGVFSSQSLDASGHGLPWQALCVGVPVGVLCVLRLCAVRGAVAER
jgi:hypothetical protein